MNRVMISPNTWQKLEQKQAELDQLIVEKNPTNLKWVSRFNVERLKLALLVEVGEFANEIKSFKAWRKKPEIDWQKAKEELIDCLGYFLGLVGIYQIDISQIETDIKTDEKKDLPFNELLLDFFAKTNDLYVEKDEQLYHLGKNEIIKDKARNTYHEWWLTFEKVCWKLKIDENELLDIYLEKNRTNLKRVHAK